MGDRLGDLRAAIRDLELQITQYRDTHSPVTLAELIEARASRDAAWRSIKAGEISPDQAAPGFESKVQSADSVSDRRHDKAQEVSELQTRLDSLQRLQNQVVDQELRATENDTAMVALRNDWAARAAEIGVPGMPLLATGPWHEAREKVLHAADTVAEVSLALDELTRGTAEAKAALAAALGDGVAVEPAGGLAALIVAAADAVDAASKARGLREALQKQRDAATLAKAVSEDKAAAARTALGGWEDLWRANLASAALSADTGVGAAEGALSLLTSVEGKLSAIRQLRKERIETMQADLDNFAHAAQVLAASVAPELNGQPPATVAAELATRLNKAKSDQTEHKRLSQELASLQTKATSAAARIDTATAGIRPILHLAKVSTNDELRAAVLRSDRWRELGKAIASAKNAAQDTGDGLSLEALETEWQSADLHEIPVVLDDIARAKEELLREQNTLSADKANASAALSKIAGQDEAARAESSRQDALAKMANAAERYIKVFTAGRLLRWAIDRYRETKQGPMLARAGEIFTGLTLGSFKKLAVDFDSDPLTLQGQRADGALVAVGGMSDGTRDQLYLALRLAALELHLVQAQSLPFVADDLFVNYDDARAKAGLEELRVLSASTQVLFLSHHDHLIPAVRSVFGEAVNIVRL